MDIKDAEVPELIAATARCLAKTILEHNIVESDKSTELALCFDQVVYEGFIVTYGNNYRKLLMELIEFHYKKLHLEKFGVPGEVHEPPSEEENNQWKDEKDEDEN